MEVTNSTIGIVLTIDALDFFTSVGITQPNITDFVYMVKGCAEDLDEDAVVTKTLVSGIAHTANSEYTVTFEAADYATDKLRAGYTYSVFVGIKTDSGDSYTEAVMADSVLSIKQDGIRG